MTAEAEEAVPIGRKSIQLTVEERALIDKLMTDAKSLQDQATGAIKMVCQLRGFPPDTSVNYDMLTGVIEER